MKEDQKLEDKEFDELIEIYKIHVNDERNRRTRKLTILWSSVSIFYILGDLHLNVTNTGNEDEGNAIAWGIPITGITEEKLLIFLFIISLYFLAKFFFSIVKLNRQLNLIYLFNHFWSLGKNEHRMDSHTSTQESYVGFQRDSKGSIGFSIIDGKFKPSQPKDESISGNKDRYDTWLFMYHYRVIGSLEYIFAPVLFPSILGIYAIVNLAIELFF